MLKFTRLSLLIAGVMMVAPAISPAASMDNSDTTPACEADEVYHLVEKKCIKVKTCAAGYMYDKTKYDCVKKESGIIPDRDLIEQAWVLARSDKYAQALDLFTLVQDRNTPEVMNGLGYTHRKLGDLQTGIRYYKLALQLDPNYVLAREYLGKGYISAGKLDLARAELFEIKARCGTSCKTFVDLSQAIEKAERKL